MLLPLVITLALVTPSACSEQLPAALLPPDAGPRFEARPSNLTCLAPPLAVGRVRLQPTYEGFVNPMAMQFRADRGLLYVGEVAGRIKTYDFATKAITTALDLSATVSHQHEGMFGFVTHPTKPYAYLTVERDLDPATAGKNLNRGEVIRFTSNDGGRTYDPASETLILRIDRPGVLHPPGTLRFGKDGFLYVAVGEVGLPYSKDALYGSILRLDVDGGTPYAIPPDNPYAKGGGRPEVWAGGFRNPWQFSFDRLTGEIWEGDVGDDAWEEINKVVKGKNYGYPTLEGNTCRDGSTTCDRTGLTPPVFVYPHSDGRSITGGFVYRGAALADLAGKYVFADFTVGHVRVLEGEGAAAKAVLLNSGGPKPLIAALGEDADGELYVVGYDSGILYKLTPGDVAAGATDGFPERLSQTGCVDPQDPKTFAAGLVSYGVNVELWADGLDKRRAVAIPDGTTVKVDPKSGHFDLPEGTVVVKELSSNGRPVETRLLRRHAGCVWTGTTYEWNDAGTDALLVEHAKEKVLPNGQTWLLPSQIQCFGCHTNVAGTTLGLETLQLNGDHVYGPSQSENQLAKLSAIGYLDHAVDPATSPRLPRLQSSEPVEDRARAYLHANCSICHRENGPTGKLMDLRYGLPLSAIHSCTPSGGLPVPDTFIIKPGAPEASALYLRMSSRVGPTMPPVGSHQVDLLGLSVVESWIRGRTSCQ